MYISKHPEFRDIRTVVKNKETWFVAQDVCDVLGIQNGRRVAKILDDDESDVTKIYIMSKNGVNQQREVVVVNESGLYTLIMRSNKPEAKRFRRWVTSEVLPDIRRKG